jgi:hypothetical protein
LPGTLARPPAPDRCTASTSQGAPASSGGSSRGRQSSAPRTRSARGKRCATLATRRVGRPRTTHADCFPGTCARGLRSERGARSTHSAG